MAARAELGAQRGWAAPTRSQPTASLGAGGGKPDEMERAEKEGGRSARVRVRMAMDFWGATGISPAPRRSTARSETEAIEAHFNQQKVAA